MNFQGKTKIKQIIKKKVQIAINHPVITTMRFQKEKKFQ
jgi:hypothetical protein